MDASPDAGINDVDAAHQFPSSKAPKGANKTIGSFGEANRDGNSIRTLTLRFSSNHVAGAFADLAKNHGYSPAWGRESDWITVTTTHRNKADRSKLISAWAKESMEVV